MAEGRTDRSVKAEWLTEGGLPKLLAVLDRFRRAVDVFRPPDPAWIRLSVMRC